MDQLGQTRTSNAANVAKYHAAHPEVVDRSNAKRVFIDGQYVGTDITTGVPGGSYKTWDEGRAAMARDATTAVERGPTRTKRQSAAKAVYNEGYYRKNPEAHTMTNSVSAMAYMFAGGSPAYFRLPQNERLALRNEARTFMAQRQVGELVADNRWRPGPTPWKSDEISHPELTRIRAEHIRRYATADRAESVARDGFVYVMNHSIYSPGIVKIGHSRDPARRASQANTNSAEGGHSIKYIRFFKDRALAESLVHSLLWHRRVQGEHFRVSVGEAIRVISGVDD